MKVKINKLRIVFISAIIFSGISYCQDYFPLEIGNRWDYSITTRTHGGFYSYSKISIEITGKNISNNKEYYVFSNQSLFNSEYLRMGNDSLFCLNTEDSTDCFIFAFNQILDSSYYSCKYNTAHFTNKLYEYVFGQPDSLQYHSTYGIGFQFSKKYGMINSDDWSGGLVESWYYLSGCIISGITYGVLLSADEISNKETYYFQLDQNYPNPFNPSTVINYSLPHSGNVKLTVYDILGSKVATIVNEYKPSGSYSVRFNGSNLASGIYLYRLEAGNYSASKKFILMK